MRLTYTRRSWAITVHCHRTCAARSRCSRLQHLRPTSMGAKGKARVCRGDGQEARREDGGQIGCSNRHPPRAFVRSCCVRWQGVRLGGTQPWHSTRWPHCAHACDKPPTPQPGSACMQATPPTPPCCPPPSPHHARSLARPPLMSHDPAVPLPPPGRQHTPAAPPGPPGQAAGRQARISQGS